MPVILHPALETELQMQEALATSDQPKISARAETGGGARQLDPKQTPSRLAELAALYENIAQAMHAPHAHEKQDSIMQDIEQLLTQQKQTESITQGWQNRLDVFVWPAETASPKASMTNLADIAHGQQLWTMFWSSAPHCIKSTPEPLPAPTALEATGVEWVIAAISDNDTHLYACTKAGQSIDFTSAAYTTITNPKHRTPISNDMQIILACIQALQLAVKEPHAYETWLHPLHSAMETEVGRHDPATEEPYTIPGATYTQDFLTAVYNKEVNCLPDFCSAAELIDDMHKKLNTKAPEHAQVIAMLDDVITNKDSYEVVDAPGPGGEEEQASALTNTKAPPGVSAAGMADIQITAGNLATSAHRSLWGLFATVRETGIDVAAAVKP